MNESAHLHTGLTTTAVSLANDGAQQRATVTETVQLRHQLSRMAALTELLARIESADSASAACQIAADKLQSYLSAERLLVGLCEDRSPRCQLVAISGVATFDPLSQPAQSAKDVLQEAIARGELSVWPAVDETRRGGLLAHRRYAEITGVPAIVSGPLRDPRGQVRGAWMVTGAADNVLDEATLIFLRAAESPVASSLHLVQHARRGLLQQARHQASQLLHERRGQMVLAAVALVSLILCLPVRYRAKCECTVEPVTRRFVAAPFDGPLENALVEPGDIVAADQLLARMDGREVRWELAGTRADLHRATKQRAGHVASHASGEAAIARYEVDRLKMRTELLEHRDRNLEIRSPIAGVVVSGDLEDAEGMPLQVGQTLFEIAPLDEMVVEVEIAEDDFAYVRPEMPVKIRLDAFPLRRFEALIERVHPRAELRNEKNIFVAEVRLECPGTELRPGMRGTARIETDRYPLGWNLFRRPVSAAVAWLGW